MYAKCLNDEMLNDANFVVISFAVSTIEYLCRSLMNIIQNFQLISNISEIIVMHVCDYKKLKTTFNRD